MNLFQYGKLTLRSGKESMWKIEADSLTLDDWECLAAMAAEILPPFSVALGVPRGGIPFAQALGRYSRTGWEHPALIAEDICTTGGSMERHLASLRASGDIPAGVPAIGVCVFARELTWPDWVTPLFAFNPASVICNRRDEWESTQKFEEGTK